MNPLIASAAPVGPAALPSGAFDRWRLPSLGLMLVILVASIQPAVSAQPADASRGGGAPAATAPGPRPYPTEAAQWPGRGVVRVFGWMTDNRREFWLRREQEQGSVVFAGDSLTAAWTSLKKDFPSVPTANRGIGGDVSRGLLFRFEQDVLELHPKAIVLLIGTNDLSAQQRPADTLFNIAAMVSMARQRNAGVPIVLCTLPPRAHAQAPVDPARLAELNAGIKAMATPQGGVAVVDLFDAFTGRDGSIEFRYLAPDRLHFSAEGYARWGSVLAPVLAKLQTG